MHTEFLENAGKKLMGKAKTPVGTTYRGGGHSGPVFGVAHSPFHPHVFLSGGTDSLVCVHSLINVLHPHFHNVDHCHYLQ